MLKKIVTLSFLSLLTFALSLSATDVTQPDPIEFDIKFTKAGETDFGFYPSSDSKEKKTNVEFVFLNTDEGGYLTPADSLYIKWQIYKESFTLSLIAQSSYESKENDFCLANIDNVSSGQETSASLPGINYSVLKYPDENDTGSKVYLIDARFESEVTSELPLEKRSCVIASNSDTEKTGEMNIQLLIHAKNEEEILNGEYAGYLVLELAVN